VQSWVEVLADVTGADMSESTAFPDFIRRIRAGDDQAARELVERYEPVIRCEVLRCFGRPAT
jgi:hypothetical protein